MVAFQQLYMAEARESSSRSGLSLSMRILRAKIILSMLLTCFTLLFTCGLLGFVLMMVSLNFVRESYVF